jgi:subfamily B ATP-binding cassette protein HlyB/CyaB
MNHSADPYLSSMADRKQDSALDCLVIVARHYHLAISAEQVRHDFAAQGRGLTFEELQQAAHDCGLHTESVASSLLRLQTTPLPAIGRSAEGGYFVFRELDAEHVHISDPQDLASGVLDQSALGTFWTGQLILIGPRQNTFKRPARRFGFAWFLPAMVKYRRLLGQVLLVSLCLQLLALVTPLFFQVVMDKVLVHRGMSMLDVLAIGLLGVMLCESLLSVFRTYLFSHTASRIDAELGAKLFAHLMNLSSTWFQSRRVGDTVARLRELDTIRQFLTGNSLTLVLDLMFSVLFIAILFSYSGALTVIVLLSLPLYVVIALVITPALRNRLHECYSRGADNQAFLVESLNGIATLKSMAAEPVLRRRWDEQLAAYVKAGFRGRNLSAIGQESIGLIGKLVTALTLWMGARLVLEGDLSVGQLVAFNLFAARVAQPVLRLSQVWSELQQVGVSIARLGDILDTPSEQNTTSAGVMSPLKGTVEFEQVRFRYRPESPEVLCGLNLRIEAGQVLGLVGRSGSGKSTLTRLLQRLYVPHDGRILIDGMDLAMVSPASLRRQMGVVLQENLLFHRSVFDNIALGYPQADRRAVEVAAQLAGAHDFIMALAHGYDTLVGEQGGSLSGGQRQRIAIARALMGDPRLLIFDEATSALDTESERVVTDNMHQLCIGRTVIIIAHRLQAVRHCHRIAVLERGAIIEQGSHEELLAQPTSQYAHLYRLQQEVMA